MRSQTLFSLVAGSACLVSAAPSAPDAGLSLIVTSPSDAGTWVTDEQKITEYRAKGIKFIDITDIKDAEVLKIIRTPDNGEGPSLSARAITYPTNISHKAEADPLIAQLSTTQPQSWAKTLTDFHTRHYKTEYGTQAATWLFDTVKTVAAPNSAITVSQFPHAKFNQPSIIVRIPGSSSPTSLVIVGAHFDSTGRGVNERGPGAIDNASGTVVLLESLRILAATKYTPQNTLEFHFYAGEEGGMLGSKEVFESYKADKKNVLAMVNTDMAGYSPSGKISIYTDYVDPALTDYVRLVAEAYTGPTTADRCRSSACSDHNSARNNGFPAAYVCDEYYNTAHRVHDESDSYDQLQWDTVLRHIKFTMAFLVEASYLV